MQYYDVYFPNEPNAAAKAIMVSCKEFLRGAGGGTYWHGLVSADNVNHADMPANVRHPSEPEAGALFKKPHPKELSENVSVHTYGIKQVRDFLGVYVPNPRTIKASKKKVEYDNHNV